MMKHSSEIHAHGRGVPRVFRTGEEALAFINTRLPPDLARYRDGLSRERF